MKKKTFKTKKIEVSKIQKCKYFIPNMFNPFNNIKTNNWFDITRVDEKVENSKLFEIQSTKKVINKNKILRSKQVKLDLTFNQKDKIKMWIEVARIVYNLTVYYFKKNKLTSFYSVRPIIKNLFTINLQHLIKVYNVPQHVIDDAINDVLKAYNTSFKLLKLKLITHFNIRYKKYSKDKQSISIQKQDFSIKQNGFFISYLGKIKSNYDLTQKNILYGTRLTYIKQRIHLF